MKRWYPVVLCAALVLSAASAAAQTPAAKAPAGTAPIVNLWYAGVTTGAAAAKKAGGAAGGEAGMRVWRNLDVSLEAGWFQNVVTRRPLDHAATLTTFLQQTQGKPAGATVKVPASYLLVNARWVLEKRQYYKFRPYGVLGVGGARTEIKPSFNLGGTDITGSLGQYGVTLGADLTGHSSHAAVTIGIGALIPYGKWYGDVGYRFTTIQTEGQATNVNRLHIGFGARF